MITMVEAAMTLTRLSDSDRWNSLMYMHSFYNKKQKNFSEKQKGFRDSLSYSTPQKSEETRGNAITQAQSHPIKKCRI